MSAVNIVNLIGKGGPELITNYLLRYIRKHGEYNVIDVKMPRVPDSTFKSGLYVWYALKLIQKINRGYRDGILHLPTQELGRFVSFLSHKHLVLTVHDIIPLELCQSPSLISRYLRRLDSRGIKSADKIIAISNHTRSDLIKRLSIPPVKIVVVHPGVDHNIFYPKTDKHALSDYCVRKPYILCVSSEQPRKNINTLLRAFALVKKECQIPHLRLLKVGRPGLSEYRAHTLRAIIEYGLSGHVILINYIPHNRLPNIYRSAEVLVFPSYYEGFGLPLLEGMASGTPIVASNASSIPEVVGDAAILVNPFDAESFKEAILRVVSDESLREKLICRGIERAKAFDWETSAEKVCALYKEVLSTEQ